MHAQDLMPIDLAQMSTRPISPMSSLIVIVPVHQCPFSQDTDNIVSPSQQHIYNHVISTITPC